MSLSNYMCERPSTAATAKTMQQKMGSSFNELHSTQEWWKQSNEAEAQLKIWQ